MAPAAGGHDRIRALVEVIHAVIQSVDGLSPRDAWDDVDRSVRSSLGAAAPGFFAPPPVASAAGGEPPRAAPGSSLQGQQLDSLELFLRGADDEPEISFSSPPPPTRSSPEVAPPPAGPPGAPALAADPPSAGTGPSESSVGPSGPELDRLQARIRELEEQNRELSAARLAVPPGSGVGTGAGTGTGPSVDRLIQALGVHNVATGSRGDLDQRLITQLEFLASYFGGNKRNLDHAFATLQLPVSIPEFPAEMRRALMERYDLEEYFESMRDCWKNLVGGTWNSLRSWCQKIERSIDPATIERTAKERGEKPWAVYQDLYQYLSLYDSVIETLRANIKALVRSNNPELLE